MKEFRIDNFIRLGFLPFILVGRRSANRNAHVFLSHPNDLIKVITISILGILFDVCAFTSCFLTLVTIFLLHFP